MASEWTSKYTRTAKQTISAGATHFFYSYFLDHLPHEIEIVFTLLRKTQEIYWLATDD